MNNSIIHFLNTITSDLKKIAGRTCGEYSYEDLYQEAFFYIAKFHKKYDRLPNSEDNEDKRWVLKRMHNHFVKWADHKFRYSIRMDNLENDEGETWNLELPADEGNDPMIQLLFKERSDQLENLLAHSYSEAKAYLVTFDKFSSDKARLSDFFLITPDTLDNRCSRAISMVKRQSSLFDYIEVIDGSFNAVPGKAKAKINAMLMTKQLTFSFKA